MTRQRRPTRSLSIALVGKGGSGVITAGDILLAAAAKAGYYGIMTRAVGPQIRGGEAAASSSIILFSLDRACEVVIPISNTSPLADQ